MNHFVFTVESAEKKEVSFFLALLFLAIPLLLNAEVFPVEHIGSMRIFGKAEKASSVIILVSGKDGWNESVDKIAVTLSGQQALVGGLDLQEYLKQDRKGPRVCPASDLDQFGKILQKRTKRKEYSHAYLMGYREGGSLVLMAQAEAPGIFAGAMSIGFCPDFPIAPEHTCEGDKLFSVGAQLKMGGTWTVLEGVGESCSSEVTAAFLQRVPEARVVKAEKDWMQQLSTIAATSVPPIRKPRLPDLPLIEYEGGKESPMLAIFYSGDGGWGEMEDEMSHYYQTKGIASVGIDSLRYFWRAPDPVDAGRDLGRMILEYTSTWKKSDVILIGYSYGADVLPFLLNRLPDEAFRKVRGVALIGPSTSIDFDITPSLEPRGPGSRLMPEIQKIQSTPLLCIGGNLEKQSLCRRLSQKMIVATDDIEMLKGGHGFGLAHEKIADLILEKLSRRL